MADKRDIHLLRSVADFQDEQVTSDGEKVTVADAVINTSSLWPFYKGEKVEFLWLDLTGAVLQDVDANGKVLREAEVELRGVAK